MDTIPIPANEDERLETPARYGIADTASDPAVDDLTALASRICRKPIALVPLILAERQWMKSKACVGADVSEMPREMSFCKHTTRAATVPNAHPAHALQLHE